MAKPLLYQPMPKWQFLAAFGGALTLHMIAVGIAALKPEEPPIPEITNLEQIAEVSFEPEAAPPEPTPPPEEEPEPSKLRQSQQIRRNSSRKRSQRLRQNQGRTSRSRSRRLRVRLARLGHHPDLRRAVGRR
jgi:hypothetical protein